MTELEKTARQEPFCYHDGRNIVGKEYADHSDVFPLYTHPQAREPLTDEEMKRGCHRSHPHENMDAMCELRTEIARLTNENARLKAAQQEPVAEVINDNSKELLVKALTSKYLRKGTKLYTAPQPAQQPLTDEEIEQCMKQAYATVQGRNLEHAFARAIEQAHGITGEKK